MNDSYTLDQATAHALIKLAGKRVVALEKRATYERERWLDASRRYNEERDDRQFYQQHAHALLGTIEDDNPDHPVIATFREQVDERPKRDHIDLVRLQQEIHAWENRNFGDQDLWTRVAGATEEIGELAHAVLKEHQGIRGTPEEHAAKMRDAIGDIVVYLINLCSYKGWSFEEILRETWAEVSQRDWTKFPKNGRTE